MVQKESDHPKIGDICNRRDLHPGLFLSRAGVTVGGK
jgi:hypothetical protein